MEKEDRIISRTYAAANSDRTRWDAYHLSFFSQKPTSNPVQRGYKPGASVKEICIFNLAVPIPNNLDDSRVACPFGHSLAPEKTRPGFSVAI